MSKFGSPDYLDDPEIEAEAEAQAEQDALEAAMEDQLEDDDASPKAQKRRALEVLDKLQSENDELRDRMLRVTAEMDNLRKRTAREISDAKQYSAANFARDMLPVADNLERALQAIPEEKREEGSDAFKALIEGVELTKREMANALSRGGVRMVEPEGQKFDPNFHQAMFEIPDETQMAGIVAQVVAPGYTIGDRVLRPAMVGVTKGGPKYEAPAQEPSEGSSEGSSEEPSNVEPLHGEPAAGEPQA